MIAKIVTRGPLSARAVLRVLPRVVDNRPLWAQINITFISDHRVQIVVGESRENANYGELGFAEARNGNPKAAWETLRTLAERNGVLEYSGIAQDDLLKVEKRVQELRAIFRRKFGLVSDPIPHVKGVGYQAVFKIGVRQSFNT